MIEPTAAYTLKALLEVGASVGAQVIINSCGVEKINHGKLKGRQRVSYEGKPMVGVDTVIDPNGEVLGYVDRRASSLEEKYFGRQLVERVFNLKVSKDAPV